MNEVLVREGLEGATVVFTGTRRRQVDCLIAVPGLIVLSLTLLTIRVPNIVRVLLFELLVVNVVLLCEFGFPEAHRLIEAEAHALEE